MKGVSDMKNLLKSIICVVLSILIIASVSVFAFAEGDLPVEIKAKAAVLMDASTGKVLMKYNENEKLCPASVTKIMPLLLVVEAIDSGKIKLNDVVTVSANAASKGGSQIWLKEGEQMTVDDLLKSTAVYSANDACTALGEYVSGSEDAFVAALNQRAAELGMKNTNFENCTGLDDTTVNHLTTALDVAIMSRELLKHEMIINYTTIWMDSVRGGETELVNTNKLVRFFEGTTGLKTGTTSKAGCCVSASAKRNGTHLIAVVLGSENSSDRFETAKSMLNWGFSNYTTVTPVIDPSLIPSVAVIGGVEESIMPVIPKPDAVLIQKGKEGEIKQSIDLAVNVAAPIEKGQVLGTVTFTSGEETLGEYKLVAPDFVKQLTFTIVLSRVFKAIGT